MLAGLNALGALLGITQVTPASFEAELEAFTDALDDYNAKRSSRQSAYNLFHTNETALSDWLSEVRNVLMARFGEHWNTMWAQAGFTQPSIGIPSRIQDRIALAQRLVAFFTANPSYEVSSMNVTAAYGTTVRTAVINAQGPLQTANVALKTASDALKAAQQTLVDSMRYVIKILSGALGKDDPRWEAFGLNIPGTRTTPAAPTGLRATIMGTQILLECDATALATRYRFRRKIVGLDTKYKLVARSTAPMAVLEGVAAGLTMEFIAQAVNGGAQSVASNPIIVVTSPAAAPEAKPEAAATDAELLAPLAAIAPNGNGNGNGSHAVNRLS